jgi:hypothetical protein
MKKRSSSECKREAAARKHKNNFNTTIKVMQCTYSNNGRGPTMNEDSGLSSDNIW